jgi:SNF2 family DNA or RNA helicase
VQNNAMEFYSMTNLALPGVLGSWPNFRRKYEAPMANGEMNASLLRELQNETKAFVLRRGSDILRQWLPERREILVFCRLDGAQRDVYMSAVSKWGKERQAGESSSASLQLVCELQKIVAHPALVKPGGRGAFEPTIDLMQSSKLRVVRALLHSIHATTTEKVLLTSNCCYSLDLLERLAGANHWSFLRVDGKISIAKRQELIETFNSTDRRACFLFLLSAKAGGAGLNITGASRLIIFEPAWNPAVCSQCCGRIWRLGQERNVVITRLVGTSTIDELIIQRQMSKNEISEMLVERNESTERAWTPEELAFVASFDTATYSRLFEDRGIPQSLASGDPVLDGASIPEITHVEMLEGRCETLDLGSCDDANVALDNGAVEIELL